MWGAIFWVSGAAWLVVVASLASGLVAKWRRAAASVALVPPIAPPASPRAVARALDIQDFDLRELVEEIADRAAARTHPKGVSFLADIDPDVPVHLRADAAELRRVLVNLTGNAVELTDAGSVVLQVRAIQCSGINVKLRIAVTDSGSGLPSEGVVAIVESRTRTDGGEGLGVALAKALIERMGGKMGVESEVGRGTTFWFELTLARQVASPSETHFTTSLRGCKVLVVDDDWRCRRVARQQLRAWGCDVVEATSAIDAIAHLAACGANDPFDLLLLDLQMPEMSGIEAARAIRANPVLRQVPIILMTSFGVAAPREATREHGFAAVITKPMRRAALLRAVWSAIGRAENDSRLKAAG